MPKGKKAEEVGVEEGERIGGAKEEEIFKAVGLDWVPPELREDRGEILAAQKHKLPDLIELEDIRGDLHLHSKWTDGQSTILEMVRTCKERGYQYCAITDHSQAVRVAGGLSAEDFKKQYQEIKEVRTKIRGSLFLPAAKSTFYRMDPSTFRTIFSKSSMWSSPPSTQKWTCLRAP